jgi:hypothetical protein
LSQSLAKNFLPQFNSHTNNGEPGSWSFPSSRNSGPPPVFMTGYAWIHGRLSVMLSDGSVYHNNDNHLHFVCENYCVVDGVTNKVVNATELLRSNPRQARIADLYPFREKNF